MKKIILALTVFLLACNHSPGSSTIMGGSAPEEKSGTVDDSVLDLTQMSSTLVYSEVYNMLVSPQNYVGKTIILEGQFNAYENYDGSGMVFGCVVMDATACCAQGLQFILDGDYTYPDDYPEIGDHIKLKGVFGTYEKENEVYVFLDHASFI